MLHGKKGFDRLVWAAQHVLNKSLNWLFLDLDMGIILHSMIRTLPTILTALVDVSMQSTGPLSAYHPTIQALDYSKQGPVETRTPSALTDTLFKSPANSSEETQESVHDTLEYLDMVALASPRVQATDHVDPFISQYSVSDPSESTSSVRAIIWHGLIDFRWALELFCSIM
jgi:ribonuclease P/MRP protein subunit RPP40